MAITGLPRSLPECANPECKAPMSRAVWRTRKHCADCATPAERMAAAMTAHDLRRAQAATTRQVHDRIERLAAKRAARTAP